MTKTENRRTGRFVDPPAQKRMVLGLTVLPLSVLMVAAVVMWISAERLFEEAENVDAPLPSLGLMTMAQFVFVIITGCLILVAALRHSHRVAGPAHRIVKSLEQVRDGDLSLRINLRGRDELACVAKELNAFFEWLEQHPPAGVSADRSGMAGENGQPVLTAQGSGEADG